MISDMSMSVLCLWAAGTFARGVAKEEKDPISPAHHTARL
jgi:hypothetical protein